MRSAAVPAFFIALATFGMAFCFFGSSRSIQELIFLAVIIFIPVFLFSCGILWLFVFRKIAELSDRIMSSPGSSGSLEELERNIEKWKRERSDEMERLNQLESYRKEYLGNISHELKTPIFNIQGYISTLLDGGMDDPKVNRDFLNKADMSVDRMIAIVEDLQTITQLEKGELEIEEERFDIVALLKDVLEAEELNARSRGVALEMPGTREEPVFVMGDRFRIRQAIVNLVVNSVKYGKENGTTQLKIHDVGEKVRVEISDNGIGIAKEHLPRIFERFYRVDKSRSREQGGTGLGLAIVKHIIEAHHQQVDVMSTEGAGSVFSFTLKRA